MKKSENKLTREEVYNEFSKPLNHKYEVVACYYWNNKTQKGEHTTCEFFNREGLKEFLYNRNTINDGVLQRFIPPKGNHNSSIRMVWTTHFCLYEQRINLLDFDDMRHDIYKKTCTYEGQEYYSRSSKIYDKL